MASFCSNCGATQPNNSTFCTTCGARQAAATSAPEPKHPVPQPAAVPPPAQPVYNPPSYGQQPQGQQGYGQPGPSQQGPSQPNYGQQSPNPQAYNPQAYSPQGANQPPYGQQPYNQQAYNQAPLPPAKGGSGMKIVLGIVIFLFVAGAATVGALWYAAHRVKDAVIERAASAGIDLNSISSPGSSSSSHTRTYKACDLLSKDDASSMLGEPIDHTEDQGTTCLYYGPAGLSGKLAQQGASDIMKNVQKPGAQVSPNDIADQMSKVMGGLAAQAGDKDAGKNGEVPLLTFIVDGDGKPQMTALTASKAIFGGIARNSSGDKEGFGSEVPGLGDRAVRMANLGLNVLKGDTLIRLIAGPVPDANDKLVTVARAILPKI